MAGTSLSWSFRAASTGPWPCDAAGLGIDQDRVVEHKLRDTGGDLNDFDVGVGPGISAYGMRFSINQC